MVDAPPAENATDGRETQDKTLTVGITLGIEGTGHHLWHAAEGIWRTISESDAQVMEAEILWAHSADAQVSQWLQKLNYTLRGVPAQGHASVDLGIDSYPHDSQGE